MGKNNVTTSFSFEDYRRLEKFAGECGMNKSEFVRSIVVAVLDDDEEMHGGSRNRPASKPAAARNMG